jgi:hypothetical protein
LLKTYPRSFILFNITEILRFSTAKMPADTPEIMIAAGLEPIEGQRRVSVTQYNDEKRPRNASVHIAEEFIDLPRPTEAELHGPNALLRVSAPIPWSVYTVAFVELVERFSYYGTQVVCKLHLVESSA